MAKVTGIGGVFFKCGDPATQRDWYRANLGIESESWGCMFPWTDDNGDGGYTVWSLWSADSAPFAQGKTAMVNYRVDDLVALLAQLRAAGVPVIKELEDSENGKFAWITDPEGNYIELWEPIAAKDDPYL